jgi:phosphatidylserine/phosphatidylglycerophosphate/cardiolipin synthase-like enzyme
MKKAFSFIVLLIKEAFLLFFVVVVAMATTAQAKPLTFKDSISPWQEFTIKNNLMSFQLIVESSSNEKQHLFLADLVDPKGRIIIKNNVGTNARVSALFHPYDDTFSAIVERMEKAQSRIDMALYNIDGSKNNPIIAFIASKKIQAKLSSGELKIRLLFEGYESKEKNAEKMNKLEDLGIDVRFVGSSKKMHHKFAVIDGNHNDSSVITGSANWSLSSKRNYNENILFFDHEEEIANNFQVEFNTLWSIAKEFGRSNFYIHQDLEKSNTLALQSFFNIDNFKIRNNRLYKDKNSGWVLTKKLVTAIDSAESHLQIATTRIKLRPLYNAIKRAAARGVKIDIVVTMGQYEYKSRRYKMKEEPCHDEYKKTCSTSKNFSVLLSRGGYEGSQNVQVRIKFFNVKTAAYLTKQMHSKYLIVDSKVLYTGSFNWSYSAEFNYIENIVRLDSERHKSVVSSFTEDFDTLFSLERGLYKSFVKRLESALREGTKIKCSFTPMALTFKEIDGIVSAGRKFKKRTTVACK